MDEQNTNVCHCHHKGGIILPLILGLSLILSAAIIGFVLYQTRMGDKTLQVTGSATKTIKSDVVKWTSVFSRTVAVSDLKSGSNAMTQDLENVKTFLKDAGISDDQITTSPVFMDQQYDYNKDSSSPTYYNLRQTVEVQSADVQKITDVAKNTQSLVEAGVIFSTQSLEYYYTKLPETRVELLASAVKDAQNRASKIAESSGQKIGLLKSASVGVVQVLPVNSVEISDYGAYDTSSIDKQVMITVRTVFSIK
jgi:hypothetical protein